MLPSVAGAVKISVLDDLKGRACLRQGDRCGDRLPDTVMSSGGNWEFV
jgi:hypothetical protein